MNTRMLMSVSALLLGSAGILLLFLPAEMADVLAMQQAALALQVVGCACFAFAMLDWTARGSVLGGIFGRPVVLANFTLFVTSALALLKAAGSARSSAVLLSGVVCAIFATVFGFLLFRHPAPTRSC